MTKLYNSDYTQVAAVVTTHHHEYLLISPPHYYLNVVASFSLLSIF